VYVGTSLELVDEAVTTLRRLLLPSLPVAVVVLAGLTWVVVGRLLTRLEANSRRQRAFAADASHELQTPLTAIRAQLEVALARQESVDWPVLARELLQGTQEMERLVRDLLFLAQEDEQTRANVPTDLVDLDDVVLEEVARVRGGSSVVLDTSKVSGAPVRGSREQLGRLVRNLLENAERHASSRVDVTLSASNGDVRLAVSDDGPGVPPQERARIFERFVRLDDARSRVAGGAGLGLSIVAAIAERHGGSVIVGDAPSGACFEVRLPSAG
ncbi:MAG TPA: HAMP domain-containing sensor histidine kinase, partial [Nocardioidaceae bacterium]|nr:HAMP domain-containing sensor histidine kinase [Nocardioidaceae bacterium]